MADKISDIKADSGKPRSSKMASSGIGAAEARSLVPESAGDDDGMEKRALTGGRFWGTDARGDLFYEVGEVAENILPGLYRCAVSDRLGYYFKKIEVSTDDLFEIPDTISEHLVAEIQKFWSLKDQFRKHGFLHKRGILMFGDPGSGKTSAIQRLIKMVIAKGDVALYADHPQVLSNCLQLLRRKEPNRAVVVVLEDFETLVERQQHENEWLSVLDGETQVDNVVFLATTNYVEKLDKRFVDRPSRFDMIIGVDMPSATARACYLGCKFPEFTRENIEEWVVKSDGFAYAHLKEMFIGTKLLGKPLDEVVKRLNNMRERNFSNANFEIKAKRKSKLGFIKDGDESTEEEKAAQTIDWDIVKEVVTIRYGKADFDVPAST